MKFQWIIDMDEKGNVQVSGPIENKVLSYGVLEVAKQAVQAFVPNKVQPATKSEFEEAKRKLG